MSSGIYSITHIETGRAYVGSSIDLHKRWREHRWQLRRGFHHAPALQALWSSSGEAAFRFEVLAETPSELLICEQQWIDRVRAAGLLLNASEFAGLPQGAMAKSADHRKKIGTAHRGMKRGDEARANMAAAAKRSGKTASHMAALNRSRAGQPLSEETRSKMSAARKGRVKSPEHKAAIAASLRQRATTPEGKEHLAMAQKAKWATPGAREALAARNRARAYDSTPEDAARFATATRKERLRK